MTFLDDNYQGVVDTITNHLNSANQQRFDFELAQEKADRRRHMRNIWFISSSVLLFIIVIAFGFGQYLKRKRAQAQMEALRAQINPHFISNSLNAIESLVNLDQREAAAKYLIHFSRLSRRILNGSRSSTSSLAEELETMRHYLTLEQLRFRDKLQYEIEVSPDLDADQLEMPAMILQPFIENAILHGIKPKSEPGRLLIKVFRRDKYLICVIEDDGIGREQAQRLKTQTALPGKHKSLGMKITRERLEGAGGRMEIEDLKSDTGEAVGTRVTLRVPYRRIREKEVVHGS